MIQISNKGNHKAKKIVTSAVVSVLALSGAAFPLAANALENQHTPVDNQMHSYIAYIHPLNHTHVEGTARFEQSGNVLKATIDATGLEPGIHPQHIHGKDQAAAECPTNQADINHDGFISVIEGAPSYGLIKMSLTNPQTTFGSPPTTALFTATAGTPSNSNFPMVGSNGILHFSHTYTFDNSEAAQAALQSLTPLGDQEVVIHGATAPKSVDATAFAALGSPLPANTDLNVSAYDVLLPAGCGEIDEATTSTSDNGNTAALATIQDQLNEGLSRATANLNNSSFFNDQVKQLSTNFKNSVSNSFATYQSSLSIGMNKDEARNQLINNFSSAKDKELNSLTEARNQQIDMLNHDGNVSNRDSFLNSFDSTLNQYKNLLEQVKNKL